MVVKSHLLFLHGALGSSNHWERFLSPFRIKFEIHNLDFPGHGNNTDILSEYTSDNLAKYVKDYIQNRQINDFSIIGYSLGGYIGLKLILENIAGYNSLITLATKLNWDRAIAMNEGSKLTIENLSSTLEKLQKEHLVKTEALIEISKDIILSIGNYPLNSGQFMHNSTPIYMLRGDKDRMVSEEEITDFIRPIPNADFISLENQPHNIEKMDEKIIFQTCLSLLNI